MLILSLMKMMCFHFADFHFKNILEKKTIKITIVYSEKSHTRVLFQAQLSYIAEP
jgi:hypothetical protein